MKSFTVFETAVIGFFTGVVVSAYEAFIVSTGQYLSPILYWLSIQPVLKVLSIPDDQRLVVGFLLTIAIFTVYGVLVGLVLKRGSKTGYIVVATALVLIVAIVFQQGSGLAATSVETAAVGNIMSQIVYRPVEKPAGKYFGNEVLSDLNGDGRADVAFMLSRNDPSRGTIYYLAASLATDDGHKGTNLVYLGDQVEPETMTVENGIINISYLDHSDKKTKQFYALVTDGALAQIKVKVKDNKDALVWGEVTTDGEHLLFQVCGTDAGLPIYASSTVLDTISAAISNIASSSVQTSSILGAFVGKTTTLASKTIGGDKKQTFLVTDLVKLDHINSCPSQNNLIHI